MQIEAKLAFIQGQQIGVGQGMNSEVFLATDPQLGGEIVVKKVPKATFRPFEDYWAEARSMFHARHDNVVPIQYACETDGHICLAMPYFKNGSLSDRIQSSPLRLGEVLRVGQGVLQGLTQIHIAGHIHFDIKPSNVLFSDTDEPMVADFGQARSITDDGVAFPPGLYWFGVPPELFPIGQRPGAPTSDVYQTGLTLYRAVNGDEFFNLQKTSDLIQLKDRITTGQFPDRQSFMPHVPVSLRRVLRQAMEVDPSQRWGTAREFAIELGKVTWKCDWRTKCHANGEAEWSCETSTGLTQRVRLLQDSPKWKVEIHRQRTGNPARALKRHLWKEGLTMKQAMNHLGRVFREFE